ncbi:hypothetical protein Bca4012_025530 [Brassica carinata]
MAKKIPLCDGRKSLYLAGTLPFEREEFSFWICILTRTQEVSGYSSSTESGSKSFLRKLKFELAQLYRSAKISWISSCPTSEFR